MPEFVNGLPLHALLVHFVVVLLPIAVLGAVVISVWPAARQRYGWLVVAVTAVATALVPIATRSGGKLKERIAGNTNELVNRHEELGNLMLRIALLLLILVVALMVVHTLSQRQEISWAKPAMVVLAVLTIGSAVLTGIHVYRVGDAGAHATWDYVKNTPPR